MRIAVEGCCHGELDAIYTQISLLEAKYQYKVDLLLICGDFQAVRNHADLQCMAVPNKYKELKDFHKYYSGQKTAPVLTIVIGGNHEASNYMWELYYGGWLAPNIYFLGHAGSVLVNNIRISGASGIFKAHDFPQGFYERLPYDSSTMRSIYHIREYCVRKLSLLPTPDIFLSHDWPHQIEHYGDLHSLLMRKKFLRADVDVSRLGSPPLMGLLMTLRPRWWFAAHLHTRYEATVVHGVESDSASTPAVVKVSNPDEIVIDEGIEEDADVPSKPTSTVDLQRERNPDEITLEDEEQEVATPSLPLPQPSVTRFLALDKCLPKRQFLEIIDVDVPPIIDPFQTSPGPNSGATLTQIGPPAIDYDPFWLAITRAFHPYFSLTGAQPPFPDEKTAREMVRKEMQWVEENIPRKLGGGWKLGACQEFSRDAPVESEGRKGGRGVGQPPCYPNSQTEAFCAMLEIGNKINGTVPSLQRRVD